MIHFRWFNIFMHTAMYTGRCYLFMQIMILIYLNELVQCFGLICVFMFTIYSDIFLLFYH